MEFIMLRVKSEAADVPSPRTSWSAFNQREYATWQRCHQTLLADSQAWSPRGVGTQLVLLGDSITESWRGTSYGRAVPRTSGVPNVLGTTLASRWPGPLALGIAADCTQHLLWRLQAGELSVAMRQAPRVIFVMLIGTNNVGRGHTPAEALRGILACATHVLNATRGKLLVNALLPRGDKRKRGRRKGLTYTADIEDVNRGLGESVRSTLHAAFPGRARFVDCGASFLRPHDAVAASADNPHTASARGGGEVVERSLMPDRLHPNAAGHRRWARCLEGPLQEMDREWA